MSIDEKILRQNQVVFGKRLKKLRLNQNFSQLDLAVICDFEKTTISRIENGRTNITLKTALCLSQALNIQLKELFDFESAPILKKR